MDKHYALKVVLGCLSLLPFILHQAMAQWVPLNGPLAGEVTAICKSTTRLFAASFGTGIYMSSDAGSSWALVESRVSESYFHTLVASGNNVVGGTESGIFVSTNGGTSWNGPLLEPMGVNGFTEKDNILFAGTLNHGLYASTDHGTSWSGVGIGQQSFTCLASDSSWLFGGTVLGGVLRSHDNGQTWDSAGLKRQSVTSLAVSGGYLFAAGYNGVFRSTNEGQDWTRLITGLTDTVVRAIVTGGSRLFAGTGHGGVFRSTDGGEHWFPFSAGLPEGESVFSLFLDSTGLLAGTENGIFHSPGTSSQWTKIGLPAGSVHALLLEGSALYACADARIVPSALYRSDDGGTGWLPLRKGLLFPVPHMVSAAAIGRVLLSGTYSGVYRLSDSAGEWTTTDLDFAPVYALMVSGSKIFAGTRSLGVYTSSDSGLTWTQSNLGLTDHDVYSLSTLSDTLFAGTDRGVFSSTDGGGSWSEFYTGLESAQVWCLLVGSGGKYAGTHLGAFRANDSTGSWISISDGLGSIDVRSLAESGGNIFAGTYGGGISLLAKGATAWIQVSEGMGYISTNALLVDGSAILAGTDGFGVWRRPLSEMVTGVGESPDPVTPSEYALDQNFPNPFNPLTQITYSIPKLSFVVLKVYDVLGRELAVLSNEVMQPGRYAAQWDASRYPSGVYFYRLTAGGYQETKRMLLVR